MCGAGSLRAAVTSTGVAQWSTPAPPPLSPLPPAGGINEQQYVRLRSEAKAPFRLTRIIFLGGLAVGAALGLFIITGRLLGALQGELCGAGRILLLVLRKVEHCCECGHGARAARDPHRLCASGISVGSAGLLPRPRALAAIPVPPRPCPPSFPGGEGAPDLQETLQNFGINAAALAVLGFFVSRDVASQRRDQAVIEREEALARLQVHPGAAVQTIPCGPSGGPGCVAMVGLCV